MDPQTAVKNFVCIRALFLCDSVKKKNTCQIYMFILAKQIFFVFLLEYSVNVSSHYFNKYFKIIV